MSRLKEALLDFDGATYSAPLDQSRLTGQYARVINLMRDGRWRTLSEITRQVGRSEAGVSARLRDARKPQFGSHLVERRRITAGTWEYRVTTND